MWNYQTDDKRGIKGALDWLIPFATGRSKWPCKEVSAFQPERLAPLLHRGAIQYRNLDYERALLTITGETIDQRWQLLNAACVPRND